MCDFKTQAITVFSLTILSLLSSITFVSVCIVYTVDLSEEILPQIIGINIFPLIGALFSCLIALITSCASYFYLCQYDNALNESLEHRSVTLMGNDTPDGYDSN